MPSSRRRISTWTMIRLCWSLKHLSVWQKMKWSVGFVENVWRNKLGLEIKPILIWGKEEENNHEECTEEGKLAD